jgi:hypothetical protein
MRKSELKRLIKSVLVEEAKGVNLANVANTIEDPDGLYINNVEAGGFPETTDLTFYITNDNDDDIIVSYTVEDESYYCADYIGYKGNIEQWMENVVIPTLREALA